VKRVRLEKVLAGAGLASRRAAEKIILAGRVEVNGRTVQELGSTVDPAVDRVSVDGRPLRERRKLYVALHKPRGYICTRKATTGSRAVVELLPAEWGHLYPVGRLDVESDGLLFLTNDGDFCLKLSHPRYGVRKTYRVVVDGRFDLADLGRLKDGILDAGEHLKAEAARLVSANNSRSIVEIDLREGRNREVRRLVGALGYEIGSLTRVRIGPIRLGDLPSGKWRTLTEPERKSLLTKL
jgi:23S rRNA pseudouridine2605 synthase